MWTVRRREASALLPRRDILIRMANRSVAKKYLDEHGLGRLIDFSAAPAVVNSPYDAVSGQRTAPFPPDVEDLARIHKMIRDRHSFTVLEFGVGYSTLVIADALQKNEADWESLPNKPAIRNRFPFQVFSVDASEHWVASAKARIPKSLEPRIHLHHSSVRIGTFQERMCHFYDNLPDVVADLIYLDGPAPNVQGSINGMSFQCDERTVMSGDLLLMEPILLPGTLILVDGRTNNARFLQRNFQRNWKMTYDREGDVTTFELVEDRLGPYNLIGSDFFPSRDR
jgi:Methyltransferase domain